jgi:hypothetical protein
MKIYELVAWAAVDHLIFALEQALLCFVAWKRGVNAARDLERETAPLLDDI